jgi:RNA polymerase sigma-70 factor (ECF subfamily)
MRFPPQDPPDPEQFQQLVEEYADRVYGIALRITGSELDAEDALQETFLSIFRGLGGFREEAAFSTWVYRIAVNAALQIRRHRPPSETTLSETGFHEQQVRDWSEARVESEAERHALVEAIEQGIRLLPEEFAVAVILRDVEGLSTGEAAAVLQIGEAALKSRLHRGRVLLRQHLAAFFADR